MKTYKHSAEARAKNTARHKAWRLKNVERLRAWRKAYRGSRSAAHRRARYGLTEEAFEAMVDDQKGLCAICRFPPEGRDRMSVFQVDHDHETGAVRALLCQRCNKGLGSFRESAAIVAKAAMYLAYHESRRRESA